MANEPKIIGRYHIEHDRAGDRYCVHYGIAISTHPTLKDATAAVERYIAGDKRAAMRKLRERLKLAIAGNPAGLNREEK